MLDDTSLLRTIAYPRAFSAENALAVDALFKFSTVDEKVYQLSVGLCHLLPSDDDKVSFGCRTVDSMNETLRARLGRDLEPHETQRYLGYYSTLYASVLAIRDAAYTLSAYWAAEGTMEEHGHIEFRDNGSKLSTKAKKTVRRHLRSRIARAFSGPVRQTCPDYEHEKEALEAIELPSAPEAFNAVN
ncbi:MAG: hypothetical protein JXR75_00275 [Rhodobacteraceae bacterium]|nr:hypothetical protein [Paracoccaceae bacterium]